MYLSGMGYAWGLALLVAVSLPAFADDKKIAEVQTKLAQVVESARPLVPARELQLFQRYYNKLIELSLKHGGIEAIAKKPPLVAELFKTPMPRAYLSDARKILNYLDKVQKNPSLACGDLLTVRPFIPLIEQVRDTHSKALARGEWTYLDHAALSRDLVTLVSLENDPLLSLAKSPQKAASGILASAGLSVPASHPLLSVFSSVPNGSIGLMDFIRISYLPLHYVAVDFRSSHYDGRKRADSPREKLEHDIDHAVDKHQSLTDRYLQRAGTRDLKTKESWFRFLNEIESEGRLVERFYDWQLKLQEGGSKDLSNAITTTAFFATHEQGALLGLGSYPNFKDSSDGVANEFYNTVLSRLLRPNDIGLDAGLTSVSKAKLRRLFERAYDEMRVFLKTERSSRF